MKTLFSLFIALMTFAGLASCTDNNGDIGDWFGTWKMTSMATDESIESVDDIFWKFQNNVVSIIKVDDDQHLNQESFGTWAQTGDVLALDFTHHDDSGSGPYIPPIDNLRGKNELTVVKLSGDKIVLRQTVTSAAGAIQIVYNLKKWG